MSKRKITRRQSWRIKKIQEERLQRANKREDKLDSDLSSGQFGPEQIGRLIILYGTQADIEDQQGLTHRCQLRQHLGSPVAGDQVVWREGANKTGIITAVSPRHSVLGRPDKYGNIKPIAANIDQMLIVAAPKPTLITTLIDSYLVAAESLQITPVIVFNKTDLLNKADQDSIEGHINIYKSIDYPIIYASTVSEDGLNDLLDCLKDKTSVFVGQSGVGKSSLINFVMPEHDIRVGALSAQSEQGMHTTTSSRLYPLPNGGHIIDSPGIREFGLWNMQAEDIAQGFKEFRPFLGQCKFRNCQHLQEPDCALRKAVKEGAIDAQRLTNFRELVTQKK